MAALTEDYVSFEIAKLLKEKGFDIPCKVWYAEYTSVWGGGKYINIQFDNKNRFEEYYKFLCYAPTLQMAMKWLREKHNIVVEPFIREDTKYVWYIHRIETKFNKKYLVFCWGSKNNKYERYEQACEAAIKYCLENLI